MNIVAAQKSCVHPQNMLQVLTELALRLSISPMRLI